MQITAGLMPTPLTINPQNPPDAKGATQEFEALFLQLLLEQMRRSAPAGGILPKSSSQKLFEAMLDTELARQMSKAGGIGLAQMIEQQVRVRESS